MKSSLYFDIGNTNIKIGVRRARGPLKTYSLPTGDKSTSDKLGLSLLQILNFEGISPTDISACLGASVVPHLAVTVGYACERFFNCELSLAPEDIPVPLENCYARPYEVGADRLVGAYAARQLFPEAPAIISVDFGTATTFDCVEGNAFLGGLICPGILSSAAALAGSTAKLPSIDLQVEETSIDFGTSTSMSLNHGFVFGFAAMSEGLVERLSAKMKGPVIVIGTGGFAKALKKVSKCFDTVWPDLVLEGLARLHDDL